MVVSDAGWDGKVIAARGWDGLKIPGEETGVLLAVLCGGC